MAGLRWMNYIWPAHMSKEDVVTVWELLGRRNPAEYEDSQREWVVRELGDCDFEPYGERLQKNYTTGENHSSQLGCAHIGETYTYQIPGPYLP